MVHRMTSNRVATRSNAVDELGMPARVLPDEKERCVDAVRGKSVEHLGRVSGVGSIVERECQRIVRASVFSPGQTGECPTIQLSNGASQRHARATIVIDLVLVPRCSSSTVVLARMASTWAA